jgi:hypothetical protein
VAVWVSFFLYLDVFSVGLLLWGETRVLLGETGASWGKQEHFWVERRLVGANRQLRGRTCNKYKNTYRKKAH